MRNRHLLWEHLTRPDNRIRPWLGARAYLHVIGWWSCLHPRTRMLLVSGLLVALALLALAVRQALGDESLELANAEEQS